VIALIVLLSLLVLGILLCLVKLEFLALYNGKLSLKLKILFLTFTLVGEDKKKKTKRKKKRKKKKSDKKSDTEDKKEKKPSYLKKLSDKKGIDGLMEMIIDISKLAVSTIKGIFTNIVIEKLNISFTVVGEDAADTAIKYGKTCAVFYPALTVICETVKASDYNVDVTPDFADDAVAKVSCNAKFYIRTFYVLKYGIKALIKMIRIRYKR